LDSDRRVSPLRLTRLFSSFASCALLSLFLLGCGPAASPSLVARASGDGSGEEVVAALSAAGVTCGPVAARTVATYVADAVSCSIDGNQVLIRTFADSSDRDRFISASGGLVEQMSLEIDAPLRVVGPTWIITTDDEPTASQVQSVLGGEIR
jgi:hypothetical protein